MFIKSLLIPSLIAAVAADKQYSLANFDDLQALPALPSLTDFDYKQLHYSGLGLTQLGVLGAVVTGVVPESPSNVVIGTFAQKLLNGVSTIKRGSEVSSFDLKKFYFGCVIASEEALLSTPTGCKITVTGYDEDNRGVANQEFKFVPDSIARSGMNEARLGPDFTHLSRVQISLDTSTELIIAPLYDSFSYVLHHHEGGWSA